MWLNSLMFRRQFKNYEYAILGLLIMGFLVLVSQLLGTGITPGDDNYFAVDRFRRQGLLDSSLSQAIGQGRFYYIFTMTLTQLLYLDSQYLFLTFAKIATNLFLFYSLFQFMRELFGFRLAAITGFVTIALLDTYGAAVNPFFAWPLMYGLGAALQIFSFWLYTKACKQQTSFFSAYVFYLASLIFYEPMLFYCLGYLCIYYYFNSDNLNYKFFGSWLKKLLIKNQGLFCVLICYLVTYYVFRYFNPSAYEGSKELTFDDLVVTAKTIIKFSLSGVYSKFEHVNTNLIRPILVTAVVCFGIFLTFLKINEQHVSKLTFKQVVKIILVISFFVFSPNFLFGFVEKYRNMVKYSQYYVASYYSAFAIIILVSLLVGFIFEFFIKNGKIKRILFSFFVAGFFGFYTFLNVSQSDEIHQRFRYLGLRWPLIKESLNELQSQQVAFNKICVNNFIFSPEDTYNYWPLYLSDYYGKKIEILTNVTKDVGCDIYLNFSVLPNTETATISLQTLDGKTKVYKEAKLGFLN